MRTIIFLFAVLVIVSTMTYATIINIPGDYSTIQAGIFASHHGDTVLVQAGIYYENINFNGHDIVLGSLFLTTADTSWVPLTIIDGNDSGSVVTFEHGEDSATVLTGFTIQNGHNLLYGGGILCNYSNPVISCNIITGNSAGGGGGIFCGPNSDPNIRNNTISGNTSIGSYSNGGGIVCYHSNATIVRNVIVDNHAGTSGGGGGIHCSYSNVVIDSNSICENTSAEGGGIISGSHSNTIITNNFICDNNVNGRGGGINCLFESNPIILNNTIAGNFSYWGGGGIYFASVSNTRVEGNTISGNSCERCGGGISIQTTIGPPEVNLIKDNSIINNTSNWDGAGIYSWISSIIITGNRICGNFTNTNGGGISFTRTYAGIIDNVICDNTASGFGGGIYCVDLSSPCISGNTISSNFASNGGGIFCISNSSPSLMSDVIYRNSASESGGAFFFQNQCEPTILNNTISENTADSIGGGIYCEDDCNIEVANSIFWGDSAEVSSEIFEDGTSSIDVAYSNIQGGWEGIGNIDTNPLFRNPDSSDFHLQDSIHCGNAHYSPCIDAGHPDSLDHELNCDHGLGASRADMGAYGGYNTHWSGVGEDHVEVAIPKDFVLCQNYPNPFNPTTNIVFQLPVMSKVSLKVFNILGQAVAMVIDREMMAAGQHTVRFDGTDLANGMYFYQLRAGNHSDIRKMVFLK